MNKSINEMSFQETLDVEQTMIKIMLDICKKKDTNAEWQFIETHKEKSKFARTDGILVKNSYMIASVENRGRYDVTWEYVKSKKTWLLRKIFTQFFKPNKVGVASLKSKYCFILLLSYCLSNNLSYFTTYLSGIGAFSKIKTLLN